MKHTKERIHELVDEANDDALLEYIYTVLNGKVLEDDLTPDELRRLSIADRQVANGQTISFQEHKRRIEEWLTRLK